MAAKPKLSPRVIANRLNGARGGRATAAKHDEEWRAQRAERGGVAVRNRYGSDYYSYIRKLRKTNKGWPKGKSRKPAPDPVAQVAQVIQSLQV